MWLSAATVSFVMVEISKMTLLIVFRMCTSVPYTSEEWSIPLDFFWHMGTSDRLLLDAYWLGVIFARCWVHYMNRLWGY